MIGRHTDRNSIPNAIDATMAQLEKEQKAVMDGYKKSMNLSEDDEWRLHMFFSPYRVPEGMTKGEVNIVIIMQKNIIGGFAWHQVIEKSYKSSMTRFGFLRMIRDIIQEMDFDWAAYQAQK